MHIHSGTELQAFCQINPDWRVVGGELVAEFAFQDFPAAVAFMQKIFQAADEHNHHPTITNTYNKVKIAMQTHDACRAITDRDTKVATVISNLSTQWVSGEVL